MYIFAYGMLKKGEKLHPKNAKVLDADAVRGELFGTAEEAYAVKVQDSNLSKSDWIFGELLDVPRADMKLMDEEEEIKDRYKRVPVRTVNGYNAEMYEYVGKIPSTAKSMGSWSSKDFIRKRKT